MNNPLGKIAASTKKVCARGSILFPFSSNLSKSNLGSPIGTFEVGAVGAGSTVSVVLMLIVSDCLCIRIPFAVNLDCENVVSRSGSFVELSDNLNILSPTKNLPSGITNVPEIDPVGLVLLLGVDGVK